MNVSPVSSIAAMPGGRESRNQPGTSPNAERISITFPAFVVAKISRIPLLAEEGWRDSRQTGAPGAKREPDRAKPQLVVSSAKHSPELTTPSAPSLRSAHPPLLCEEGNAPFANLTSREFSSVSQSAHECRGGRDPKARSEP